MLQVYSPSSALFTVVMTRLDSSREILWIGYSENYFSHWFTDCYCFTPICYHHAKITIKVIKINNELIIININIILLYLYIN